MLCESVIVFSMASLAVLTSSLLSVGLTTNRCSSADCLILRCRWFCLLSAICAHGRGKISHITASLQTYRRSFRCFCCSDGSLPILKPSETIPSPVSLVPIPFFSTSAARDYMRVTGTRPETDPEERCAPSHFLFFICISKALTYRGL